MSDDALREIADSDGVATGQIVDFTPIIDELYRQEVLEARRMSPEDKLILGERLFRWACAITLEGVRMQNPEADEVECQRLLRARIELGKKLGTL